jgi:polar amino acid transport system substrate-binding protein
MHITFSLISLFLIQNAFGMSDAKLRTMMLPNNRVIKITGHPQYPPYVWKEPNKDQLTGFAIELLKMAFAEINVKTEIIYVGTWGRAQEEVKLGHIDILVPPYKNDERIKFFNFPRKAISMDETVLFVNKNKNIKFSQFSDLKKYKGVAIINDSFGSEFDQYDKEQLHIERLTSTEQCMSFLSLGRADYVIAGYYAGLSVIRKLKLENVISRLPKEVIVTGMYAPISLKSVWNKPEIIEFLDRKIGEYEKSGILKKLEKKYALKMKQSEI